MNKFFSFIFSMAFTGVLLVVFAISIAYATFIENDFGTATAKILVYNAKWFEVLLIFMSINLIGSVFVNNLIGKKQWPVFLFHVAFVVILIGAGITRYYSYEGAMHIREGESTNFIVSDATYINIEASSASESVTEETQVMFSPYTANRYTETLEVGEKTIEIENQLYMPSAAETVVIDPAGEPIVSMLALNENMQRVDFNLKQDGLKQIGNFTLGFEAKNQNPDISLTLVDGVLMISANDSLMVSGMMQASPEVIPPDSLAHVDTQKAYTIGNSTFAVKQYFSKGKTQLVYSQPSQTRMALPDALQLRVASGGETKNLVVYGEKGVQGEPYSTTINGVTVTASYGSKNIELPFAIYLEDFQLERYPGSNSPSSYASEVVVKDGPIEKPFRIFMNNILKYQGYRFFQSSYDTDEQGTILSVNYDTLGTTVTYIGYFLMTLGMVLTLFIRNSRFKNLLRVSGKLSRERKKLIPILLFGLFFTSTVNGQPAGTAINDDHAENFETLVVQSNQGRLEPVATLASEILRKVAKETSWKGMSPTEVYLDMMANPETWKNEPIIKISNPELRKQLGVTNGKFATFNMIVAPREMGGYRLGNMVQAAYAKPSNQRNKLDKEIMNVDERINILMNVFTGSFLTIFPVPGDANHKWEPVTNASELGPEYAEFARETLGAYLSSVSRRDWATAGNQLEQLKAYQQQYGSTVIPSQTRIKLEVLYQKWDIFSKLSKLFMFTGLILLFLQLLTLFSPKIRIRRLKQVAFIFVLILFLVQTAGMGIRWYISGHAPWSNGYETMLFISWATCMAGLIFTRRSEITLSLTTLLAGLTLMVAGMSWMSPELTNLVPVLKSYWLIVHVAIITSSYGFFGIAALLGLLNLVLMIFRSPKNQLRINFTIKELVHIIQVSLIIGLFLLTIGSFIGGVWANESWGRYWGWDPKETWALVTIIVYTFIGHMHKIPGFKGHFAVSTGALLAIGSVLMTFFGVNYYLSGLHSYAQGEPAPIPSGIYVAVVLVFIIILAAMFSERSGSLKKEEE